MALTERYVDASAAGGGDGTTAATSGANGAFTWAEMITDINTPRVGYRYNVKQGTYSLGATTTLTGDGSTTSPNIIRGYKTTIGDATLGRISGGTLDSSNMPTIEYASTFGFNATGATHLIIEALIFTGTISNGVVRTTTESEVRNCVVTNSSGNASAIGIEGGTNTSIVYNCDVSLPAGHASAKGIVSTGTIRGNRVTGNNASIGIELAANGSPCSFNTVFECGDGIKTTSTGTRCQINQNTIANCTGDGIEIINGTTVQCIITDNHITGCTGFAINFNTSTCSKLLENNRFRDNNPGGGGVNISGDGDWGLTTYGNITSDDADSDDFTDVSTDDYSLKAAAPGRNKAVGYLNDIGANGSPVVSGGGGGPLSGPGRLIRN